MQNLISLIEQTLIFCHPAPSKKRFDIFPNFKSLIACLNNSTFLRADTVKEITRNASKLSSSKLLFKKFNFLRTNSVYELTWNKPNFQRLNQLLENDKLFAKTFIVRHNLTSFRCQTWLAGLKNFFAIRFRQWNCMKYFNFKDAKLQ